MLSLRCRLRLIKGLLGALLGGRTEFRRVSRVRALGIDVYTCWLCWWLIGSWFRSGFVKRKERLPTDQQWQGDEFYCVWCLVKGLCAGAGAAKQAKFVKIKVMPWIYFRYII